MSTRINVKLLALTVIMLGIQVIWTVELAQGTLYLVDDLGLSPQYSTLVWLAGPLSGLLVQPWIGYKSDVYGKRKPFLLLGSLFVSVSVLLIAFSNNLMAVIFGFYLLDFSINVTMAMSRLLILDCLEPKLQVTGNAFASAMINCGNLIGYGLGYLKFGVLLPDLDLEQIQILCLISLFIFWISLSITCFFTMEKKKSSSISEHANIFVGTINALGSTPAPIQYVFNVQFFAWIGWFPFLFYISPYLESLQDPLDRDGRVGSLGLFFFALLSIITSLVLPPLTSTLNLDIRRVWKVSFLVHFVVCLVCILFVRRIETGLALVSLLGVPWYCTMWIPYALINEYLSSKQNITLGYESLDSDDDEPDTSHLTDQQLISEEEPLMNGLILGLHNVYICVPQFISIGLCSLVFWGLGSESFGNMYACVIGLGLLFTLSAFFLA